MECVLRPCVTPPCAGSLWTCSYTWPRFCKLPFSCKRLSPMMFPVTDRPFKVSSLPHRTFQQSQKRHVDFCKTFVYLFKVSNKYALYLGCFLSVHPCPPLSPHPFSPLSLGVYTSPFMSHMHIWLHARIYNHIAFKNHVWKEICDACLSETGVTHLIWRSLVASFYPETTFWVCLLWDTVLVDVKSICKQNTNSRRKGRNPRSDHKARLLSPQINTLLTSASHRAPGQRMRSHPFSSHMDTWEGISLYTWAAAQNCCHFKPRHWFSIWDPIQVTKILLCSPAEDCRSIFICRALKMQL